MHRPIVSHGPIVRKDIESIFVRSIDAYSFRNQKEMELGVKDRESIEAEVIFLVLFRNQG